MNKAQRPIYATCRLKELPSFAKKFIFMLTLSTSTEFYSPWNYTLYQIYLDESIRLYNQKAETWIVISFQQRTVGSAVYRAGAWSPLDWAAMLWDLDSQGEEPCEAVSPEDCGQLNFLLNTGELGLLAVASTVVPLPLAPVNNQTWQSWGEVLRCSYCVNWACINCHATATGTCKQWHILTVM